MERILNNPWKEIMLSDYESHMSLDSVRQLQSMNRTMKSQLTDYPVDVAMILGIAGGNGLEHVDRSKFHTVYGVDINEEYLREVELRYRNLDGILQCLNLDLIRETDELPKTPLLIANLLIEYIGYEAFARAVQVTEPKYVSCVIQINEEATEWVSDSPYIHVFDGLDAVHHPMEEEQLDAVMRELGFDRQLCEADVLPNGKALLRLDYSKE